ncbi:L-gulonolactone oxidase [Dirofilaria immitis]
MSISDCDKYDDINNCWTSSDTEHSLSKMSSGDSLDEIDDKMNSDNAPESNVAANMRYDRKKLSIPESDLELNFTSDFHSIDSLAGITHERSCSKSYSNSKMDHASDEIPDLVDDDDDSTDDVEILDNKKPDDELSNEADDEFVMKQLEKLIIRRNKKDNEARLRWLTFLREQKEAQEERKQFEAYWKRRHQEDKDLWRDKDFANAIYKMCRAGYKGKHGNFDVPEQIMQQMDALYMQVTVGDYGKLSKVLTSILK